MRLHLLKILTCLMCGGALSAQNCVIDAGSEQLICGYTAVLEGTPAGGSWEVLCAESPGSVHFQRTADNTTATVTQCGIYTFVYRMDVPGCVGTDTVRITYDDPDYITELFESESSITCEGECPPQPPICSDGEGLCMDSALTGSMNPMQWTVEYGDIISTGRRITLFSPRVIGMEMGCVVDSIVVDTLDFNDEINCAQYPNFINPAGDTMLIVSNLDTVPCPVMEQIDDCATPVCTYITVRDTLQRVNSRVTGYRWHYRDSAGELQPMNDTTLLSWQGATYAVILSVGAYYSGQQTIRWRWIDDGLWLSPLSTVDIFVRQVAAYERDTVTVVVERQVPENLCCTNYRAEYSLTNPPIPPEICVCDDVHLRYCPPVPLMDIHYFVCPEDCADIGAGWSVCEAGEYSEVVADGECLLRQRHIVHERPGPSPFINVVPATITCLNSSVTLQADPHYAAYEWNGPGIMSLGNTPVVTVDEPGFYTLLVVDHNGCEGIAQIEVEQDTARPQALLADGQLGCAQGPIVLSTAGSSVGNRFAYQTTTADGHIVSGQTGPNPVVDRPGTYTLTVTNTVNGCTQSASAVVSQPMGVAVSAGADTLICGYTAQLAATPEGGSWQVLCTPENGAVAFGDAQSSSTDVTVSACGDYVLVYTYSDASCTSADTVVVHFAIPSESQTVYDLAITLEYEPPICVESAEAICFSSLTIPGGEIPGLVWRFCRNGSQTFTFSTFNPVDVLADCLYDSIAVGTETRTATSESCSTHSDVSADNFLNILDELALNTALPIPLFCPPNTPPCPDTLIMDTVALYIPVRVGGRWHIQAEDGTWSGLQDSTLLTIGETDFQLIMQPSADYPGPDGLTFTMEQLQDTLPPLPLTDTLAITLQWRDVWAYDTLFIVNSRLLPLDPNCMGCGNHLLRPPVIEIPPVPLPPCDPITIVFRPPTPDRMLYEIITCDVPCVDTPLGTFCESGQAVQPMTDENGCLYLLSVVVEDFRGAPAGSIVQNDTWTCQSPAAALAFAPAMNSASYTVEWRRESGEWVGNTDTIVVTQPGVYSCVVVNEWGCQAVFTTTVADETQPVRLSYEVLLDCNQPDFMLEICPGVTVDVTQVVSPYLCTDAEGCPMEVFVGVQYDLDAPVVSSIEWVCDDTNTTYAVLFDTTTLASYAVTTTSGFENIPSCGEYDFVFTGSNGCTTPIVGNHCCACTTQAGTLSATTGMGCDTCITLVYNSQSQVLDANDVVQFVWHTAPSPELGTVLFTTDVPVGCFDAATMFYDTDYYVTARVGNNDGSSAVDPADQCATWSNTATARWSRNSTTTYLNATICPGGCFDHAGTPICEGGEYVFHYENALGCDSVVVVQIVVTEALSLQWSADASCPDAADGAIHILGGLGGTPPYIYAIDGVNYFLDTLFVGLSAGEYTLSMQDANGCLYQENVDITALPELPQWPDSTIHLCETPLVALRAIPEDTAETGMSFTWQDGTQQPTITARQGEYWVDIADRCQTVRRHFSIINDAEPIDQNIYVPNAFSPNGDDVNDLFMPYTPYTFTDYTFMVFNRWGDMVFYSEKQGEGWDGTFIDQAPKDPAVVVWVLQGEVVNCAGKTVPVLLFGDVVIIR